jgi:hypothetical protein
MKRYSILFLHGIGIFLAYVAIGVILKWIFEISIPVPFGSIVKSVALAVAVLILMPVIGVISIKFSGSKKIDKIIGYAYLILWVLVILRSLVLIFSK